MSWPEIDALERHPAFAVAGIAGRVAVGDYAAVARLWQALDPAALAAAVSERTSDRLFALYTDRADGDGAPSVLAVVGLAVPAGAAVAAPFEVHAAPAATYAVVVADGPMPDALTGTWRTIRESDLPRGGGAHFEMHERPPLADGDGQPAHALLHVAIDPAAFAHPALASRLAAVARAGVVRRLTFDDRGLIPAVAQQHDSGEVLMVAWMNRQAVEETLATRQVTYWSRSRGKLWRKGETSGHSQRLVDLRIDCDGDTLLVLVDQTGPACHTGEATCFFRSAGTGVLATVGDRPRRGPAATD